MNDVKIYTETALTKSKENNLTIRAEIFEKYYIPYLKKFEIFSEGMNCIELGCGQGHKLEKLIKEFSEVVFTGIDNSEQMLSKGIKRLPHSTLLLGDITNLRDIPDNTQDIVCIFQVLHHLGVGDRNIALQEINRILKNEGYVVIIDSFPFEGNFIKNYIWHTSNRFYAVLSQYPDKSLQKRIKEAVKSIIFPLGYNPEDFGYYPIELSDVLGDNNQLNLIHNINPRILGKTIPCISNLLVFQKN